MENKRELFKISVSTHGIKKKCRKSDFHFFKAGHIPYNEGTFNKDEIEAVARGIIESNMKEVKAKIMIHLDHITQDENFEQWEPFSNKNVRWELKSSLENVLT